MNKLEELTMLIKSSDLLEDLIQLRKSKSMINTSIIDPPADMDMMSSLVDNPPPLGLKHLPMYMVPYQIKSKIDCKYLSFGLGQWRKAGEMPLSLKTWRKNGPKGWSRMSEEMPVSRNIDLTILAALIAQQDFPEELKIPANTFTEQPQKWSLHKLSSDFLEEEKVSFLKRLSVLKEILNNIADI
ncbi:hypothetical protein FAI41_03045 [Acetobacteraceae bacterium]|nr:hypothetical protein FAI41_03045 [Acetobacteraceae bacterium]